MEAKELRIGNYVGYSFSNSDTLFKKWQRKDQVKEIWTDEIMLSDGCVETIEHIKPIPLTKERLINLGFKKIGDREDYYLNGVFIHKRERGWVFRKSTPIIESVHQLQNLYYALKGKELIFIS